jgi:hypothetical protein
MVTMVTMVTMVAMIAMAHMVATVVGRAIVVAAVAVLVVVVVSRVMFGNIVGLVRDYHWESRSSTAATTRGIGRWGSATPGLRLLLRRVVIAWLITHH